MDKGPIFTGIKEIRQKNGINKFANNFGRQISETVRESTSWDYYPKAQVSLLLHFIHNVYNGESWYVNPYDRVKQIENKILFSQILSLFLNVSTWKDLVVDVEEDELFKSLTKETTYRTRLHRDLIDATNKYQNIDSANIDLRSDDIFIKNHINDHKIISKEWNWKLTLTYYGTLIVNFQNSTVNTFMINNIKTSKILEWFEGSLEEQK